MYLNNGDMNSSEQIPVRHAESGSSAPPRRLTRRGEIVLNAIVSSRDPMTPPEIHARIWDSKVIKRICLITVYRTLKFLLDEGLVRKVILPNGQSVYESSRNIGSRSYFLCRRCNGIFSLESVPCSEQPRMSGPDGSEVDFQELFLFGSCGKCRGSMKKNFSNVTAPKSSR